MDRVQHILQQNLPNNEWHVSRPQDGQQKESYVAQAQDQKVFVKFDVPVAALQRLAEIGVAPPVLACGQIEGHSYVIQAYITADYPDSRWFTRNLALLAAIVKTYHTDEPLTRILAANQTTDYAEHVTNEIATLESQFATLAAPALHEPAIVTAFAKLKAQAKQLRPTALVPVHPDPNTKNLLLSANRLIMVDWDDIHLSDSMHDVSLLLWWYVPQRLWPHFFQIYSVALDKPLVSRIHWWAAKTSLSVAVWHIEHSYDCQAFLTDFMAALNGKSNPHAAYSA